MSGQSLIALSQLEESIGLDRFELLLLTRKLGIETIRKGMRTYINQQDARQIEKYLEPANNVEVITPEMIDRQESGSIEIVGNGENWEQVKQFASLKMLRERLEIIDKLISSGIELESRQLCDVLNIGRIPQVVKGSDGSNSFQKFGLVFLRIERPGKRTSWRIVKEFSGDE